jgi:hypothetical protein
MTDETVSRDDLAVAIADQLGHIKNQKFVRQRLEQYRIEAADREDLEQQRERLGTIERTCREASKALWSVPQELDWSSGGIGIVDSAGDALAELNRLAKELRQREPDLSPEQAFTRVYTAPENRHLAERERQQNRPPLRGSRKAAARVILGPTLMSLELLRYSIAAGQAASKLPKRRGKGIPDKDVAAHYGWLLIKEFHERPASGDESTRPRRTAADAHKRLATHFDFVKAHWPEWSPKFRAAHNRMLVARGKQLISEPAIDRYRPPKKPRFPWSLYLDITALVHEYFPDERKKPERFAPERFATACRKVLKQTGDRPAQFWRNRR